MCGLLSFLPRDTRHVQHRFATDVQPLQLALQFGQFKCVREDLERLAIPVRLDSRYFIGVHPVRDADGQSIQSIRQSVSVSRQRITIASVI